MMTKMSASKILVIPMQLAQTLLVVMTANVKTALTRQNQEMEKSRARILMSVSMILVIPMQHAQTLVEVMTANVTMALTRQNPKMEKLFARILMSVRIVLVIPTQLAQTQLEVMNVYAKRVSQAMVRSASTLMNAKITLVVPMPHVPIPLVHSNAFVWMDGKETALE